tara:strand:- start:109 stop:831 length:723 start_codon:yes stop_codon:yes gene_type:complete
MAKKGKQNWIFGKHAVEAALEFGRRPIYELWISHEEKELEHAARAKNIPLRFGNRKDFDKRFPNKVHQNVAANVGPLEQPALEDVMDKELLLILDQITDPHNLGAILRSADAFGCGAVILPANHSAPISDVTAKAASGALETVPIVTVPNLVQALKKLKDNEYWSVGLTAHTNQILEQVDLKGKMVIVMGSEGDGMRRLVEENCDFLAKLPMVGTVESLNVSVATAISLYEAQRQRTRKK